MDTLVGLAAFAAWATALLNISSIPVTSFGSLSVMLIALHLAGRYIESRLRYRASSEIRSLLEMRPSTATILIGEKEEEIPIENVPVGALLVVRSGERIPLDGIIKQGSAYIDESMITGEPLRVHKRESEEVTGGTVLESGFIKLEVIRTGEDTFYFQNDSPCGRCSEFICSYTGLCR
jgi:Cu+-exporting ATPase